MEHVHMIGPDALSEGSLTLCGSSDDPALVTDSPPLVTCTFCRQCLETIEPDVELPEDGDDDA